MRRKTLTFSYCHDFKVIKGCEPEVIIYPPKFYVSYGFEVSSIDFFSHSGEINQQLKAEYNGLTNFNGVFDCESGRWEVMNDKLQ